MLWGSLQLYKSGKVIDYGYVSMHFVLWGSLQLGRTQSRNQTDCVSMHFVLWGSLQPGFVRRTHQRMVFQCTSCFGVLFNIAPLHKPRKMEQFQCTSCFGVLFNVSWNGRHHHWRVSMHFVLWGSLQPETPSPLPDAR